MELVFKSHVRIKINKHSVGFEVVTTVTMKITLFSHVIEVYLRFAQTCCIYHQGTRERSVDNWFLQNIGKL
jgi:hypothetical protein